MRVHIVGSGCPDPRAERFGSAFILETGGECILIDCGPATTYKMARMGLHPLRVGHVFLTHHHSDHNADMPCFILVWWDQSTGNEPPLHIYGPAPTQDFVDRLVGERGAFRVDIEARLRHPASHHCHRNRGGVMPRPAPAFDTRDLHDGDTVRTESWTARAATVKHVGPTLESLAYRFDTVEGSVVFAGDCADCEALRKLATGADTLVAAGTHFGEPSVGKAIVDCITGVHEVAAIANTAGVKRVILTHMSPNFENPETRARAVAQVRKTYHGEVLLPDELSTLDL